MKRFWENNWKWLISIIFIAGVNFGGLQMTIDGKINEKEARAIAKEEINDKLDKQVYSLISGTRLEEEMKNLKTSLEDLKVMQNEVRKDIKELLRASN